MISVIILKRLYLGNVSGRKKKYMEFYNVKTVVNCGGVRCRNLEKFDGVQYRHFDLIDKDEENISRFFSETYEFIDSSINERKPVFVHCLAGISRSVTIVIAYIMKKRNLDYQEAFQYVKKRRKAANPNLGFRKQLKRYEEHLQKNKVKED